MTLSLYVPGDSPLHRLPPALKLAGLLVAGVGLALSESPAMLGGLAGAGLLLMVSTGAPWPVIRRQLGGLVVVVGLIVAANALITSLEEGVAFALRVIALVSYASAVTFSTRTDAILDLIDRALSRCGRPGRVAGERLGLVVALVIRFVPELFSNAAAVREACAARGIRPSPLALVLPLIVRTLRTADEVADALDARGYPRDH